MPLIASGKIIHFCTKCGKDFTDRQITMTFDFKIPCPTPGCNWTLNGRMYEKTSLGSIGVHQI